MRNPRIITCQVEGQDRWVGPKDPASLEPYTLIDNPIEADLFRDTATMMAAQAWVYHNKGAGNIHSEVVEQVAVRLFIPQKDGVTHWVEEIGQGRFAFNDEAHGTKFTDEATASKAIHWAKDYGELKAQPIFAPLPPDLSNDFRQ